MSRARLVAGPHGLVFRTLAAIGLSAICGAPIVVAQTPTPPEGWVVLPVDEYRALRDRAFPPAPLPAPPPVDATLTRVDYDLRVDGD